jgi:TRAP-type C4-dicarboxylate transport system permease small subunit
VAEPIPDNEAVEGSSAPQGGRDPASAFGLLVDGLSAVGSIVIALMMVMICADVVSRNIFATPISGVSELTAMGIVVIVFLSLASTLRHGRMSRADLFIASFAARRPRAGGVLEGIYLLCGALVCGIIASATWPALERAIIRGEFVGTQGVFTAPTWPVRLAVMVGATIAAVQFLVFAYAQFRAAWSNRRGSAPSSDT